MELYLFDLNKFLFNNLSNRHYWVKHYTVVYFTFPNHPSVCRLLCYSVMRMVNKLIYFDISFSIGRHTVRMTVLSKVLHNFVLNDFIFHWLSEFWCSHPVQKSSKSPPEELQVKKIQIVMSIIVEAMVMWENGARFSK